MWFFALIALLAGAANPLQAAANAQLNRQLHHPLWAGLAVYASGLAGLLLVLGLTRPSAPADAVLSHVSPWAWLGGLISLVPTMVGLLLAQRLGSGVFTGLSVTASLIVSVVIDQFGVLGFRQHVATPGRLLGCLLMIAGVWLIASR